MNSFVVIHVSSKNRTFAISSQNLHFPKMEYDKIENLVSYFFPRLVAFRVGKNNSFNNNEIEFVLSRAHIQI